MWTRRRPVVIVTAAVLITAVTVAAGLGWARRGAGERQADPDPTAAATGTPTRVPVPTAVPSPTPGLFALLDGSQMTAEEWRTHSGYQPLAVMIDNAPAAFPHYGLAQADLVYEALVEGSITRFMAVYWHHESERIEPVRSARTPFVIWAAELQALYAHAGGAETANEANAIGQISEWSIADLDGLLPAAAPAYYRDSERFAPHNFTSSTKALREMAASLGLTTATLPESWPFKADLSGTRITPIAGAFELAVSPERSMGRLVQWRWDPATNSYLRYQWGIPHIDAATGEQLRFKTVVVMRVPSAVVDFSGHVVLSQIGEGPASVFVDGHVVTATWRKASRTDRTRFFDANGIEVAFNRGPIFIQVINPDSYLLVVEDPDGLPPLPYVPVLPAPQPGSEDSEFGREEPRAIPSPISTEPAATKAPSPTVAAGTPSPSPQSSATTQPPASPQPSGTTQPSATPQPSGTAEATATSPPASPSPAAPPESPTVLPTP